MTPDTAHTLSLQLLDCLRSRGVNAGERLPGERRLAQLLGRSRNTVRELLLHMAGRGLVDIRPCSGTYLRAAAAGDCESALPHALEALGGLAPLLAARACASGKARNMAQLEAVTTRLGQALIDARPDQARLALLAFYGQLARGNGGPLPGALLDRIRTFTPTVSERALPPSVLAAGGLQDFFNAHVELLRAIRNLDAARAHTFAAASVRAFARPLRDPSPRCSNGSKKPQGERHEERFSASRGF